jgi:hypothetical protein
MWGKLIGLLSRDQIKGQTNCMFGREASQNISLETLSSQVLVD